MAEPRGSRSQGSCTVPRSTGPGSAIADRRRSASFARLSVPCTGEAVPTRTLGDPTGFAAWSHSPAPWPSLNVPAPPVIDRWNGSHDRRADPRTGGSRAHADGTSRRVHDACGRRDRRRLSSGDPHPARCGRGRGCRPRRVRHGLAQLGQPARPSPVRRLVRTDPPECLPDAIACPATAGRPRRHQHGPWGQQSGPGPGRRRRATRCNRARLQSPEPGSPDRCRRRHSCLHRARRHAVCGTWPRSDRRGRQCAPLVARWRPDCSGLQ